MQLNNDTTSSEYGKLLNRRLEVIELLLEIKRDKRKEVIKQRVFA